MGNQGRKHKTSERKQTMESSAFARETSNSWLGPGSILVLILHANLHNAYNTYIRWYSQKRCYNIAYVTNVDEKSHCPYISETERTRKEKDPPRPLPLNKGPPMTWGQWKAHRTKEAMAGHNTRVNTCAQGKCKKHAFKQAPCRLIWMGVETNSSCQETGTQSDFLSHPALCCTSKKKLKD